MLCILQVVKIFILKRSPNTIGSVCPPRLTDSSSRDFKHKSNGPAKYDFQKGKLSKSLMMAGSSYQTTSKAVPKEEVSSVANETRHGQATLPHRSISPARAVIMASPVASPVAESHRTGADSEISATMSSSSDFLPAAIPPTQSRLLRRPFRFNSAKKARGLAHATKTEEDEDEDEDPESMPFAASISNPDPSATLREEPIVADRRGHHAMKVMSINPPLQEQQSQTSDSSGSSTRFSKPQVESPSAQFARLSGTLSPRRTAELSGRSPAGKSKLMREGSEGSPSMGSSFSDLDDASVTQSALEEALASNMRAGGGMASRIGNIGKGLKSRYL